MRSLIVTGATGGLGTEVVRVLQAGYTCTVLYRHEESFSALRRSLGVEIAGLRADLADPASVRAAVGSVEAPYGLVHLAGGFAPGSLAETTDETWAHMLELNLTAAFVVLREMVAVMSRERPGRIVVISSDATRSRAGGSVAYTVAKSGLNALVELVAKEFRGTGITVNAILPSALDTPAMRGSLAPEKLVPLARVAETLQFLLSDSAANINGALIPLTAR